MFPLTNITKRGIMASVVVVIKIPLMGWLWKVGKAAIAALDCHPDVKLEPRFRTVTSTLRRALECANNNHLPRSLSEYSDIFCLAGGPFIMACRCLLPLILSRYSTLLSRLAFIGLVQEPSQASVYLEIIDSEDCYKASIEESSCLYA